MLFLLQHVNMSAVWSSIPYCIPAVHFMYNTIISSMLDWNNGTLANCDFVKSLPIKHHKRVTNLFPTILFDPWICFTTMHKLSPVCCSCECFFFICAMHYNTVSIHLHTFFDLLTCYGFVTNLQLVVYISMDVFTKLLSSYYREKDIFLYLLFLLHLLSLIVSSSSTPVRSLPIKETWVKTNPVFGQ